MQELITRRTFVRSAALLSAAALAFPWRSRAEEDFESQNWKYAGGRYWVACLGSNSDFGSSTPCLVKALYRNRRGELMDKANVHVRWERIPDVGQRWSAISATCTHLKCTVEFNAERDRYVCPCHGSEFGLDGLVLRRPAKHNLKDLSKMLILEDGEVFLRHKARRKEYEKPPEQPPQKQPR